MQMNRFTPPKGSAPIAAVQLATDYHTPAMFSHVTRSWYWARGFAALEGLTGFDDEMLYVSALLHDIGTTSAFDNHTLSYEEAGGHVAVAMTAGAGWPASRQQRAFEVIVRHNWSSVDPAFDLEGYLLESATDLDITGSRSDALPQSFRDQVLNEYPRLSLAQEFTACVTDQAARKPTTTAYRIANNNLAQRMLDHPFEQGDDPELRSRRLS